MSNIDLKQIVEDFPDCIRNWSRLRAVLKDYYPLDEDRVMVNTILALQESGMSQRIRESNSIDNMLLNSITNAVNKSYGIEKNVIHDGIKKWASVWNIPVYADDSGPYMGWLKFILAEDKQELPKFGDYSVLEYGGGLSINEYHGCDKDIVIPHALEGKKVLAIGQNAFNNAKNIETISVDEGIEEIGLNAFARCSAKKISLPESITHISSGAFAYCNSLAEIDLPSRITTIAKEAFSYCSSLASIVLPKGLKEIEPRAFQGCKSLKQIIIPNNVTKIGDLAFCDCKLSSISFSNNSISFGDRIFSSELYSLANYGMKLHVFDNSDAYHYAQSNGFGDSIVLERE